VLIIPAIDLREGLCVRLTQGRKEDVKVYAADPAELAQRYQKGGARFLHIVDLDGAFSDPNSRNRLVLGEIISRIEIPVQFGGGLRNLTDIEQVIELGVTRVVLGTLAVESPEILSEALRLFGADRVAVGIDARDGRVLTRGWNTDGELSAVDLAQRVAGLGVERIIYTDIARDGMLTGINIEQTCMIAREAGLKVTASGGISSLADLEQLRTASNLEQPRTASNIEGLSTANKGGVDSVIIGKALYEGRFTIEEALREG
jgi:phosphoribosylformimino-5-aminoimidazole carboxamide ribotide isomerase